jgi:hypothetical protein
MIVAAVHMQLLLMGVRAVVVMRMTGTVPVAVPVAAEVFVREGRPRHR